MSYKFHGHGPGAKKVAKRLAQIQDAERTAVDQMKGGSMALLQRAQAATGSAHVAMTAGQAASDYFGQESLAKGGGGKSGASGGSSSKGKSKKK